MKKAHVGRGGTAVFRVLTPGKTRIMLRGAGGLLDLATSPLLKPPRSEPYLDTKTKLRHLENLLFLAGNQLEVHYLNDNDQVTGVRTLFGVLVTRANEDGSFDISYEDEVMSQGEIVVWDTREQDESPCGEVG